MPGSSGSGSAPGHESAQQQSWFAQAAKPADATQTSDAPQHGMHPMGASFDPVTSYNGNGGSSNGLPSATAPQGPWPAQGQAPHSFDAESTAAWSLADEAPSGPHVMPQPIAEPTSRDVWSMPEGESRNGESIVPDSWFAGPRATDPRQAEAQGPAMWTPPPTDAEPTSQVPWGTQSLAPPPGPQQQFGQPGPGQFGAPAQGSGQFGSPGPGPQQFGSVPAGPTWGPEPQRDWPGGPAHNETALLQGPGGGLPPTYPASALPLGQGPGMPEDHQPKSEASRSLIIAVVALVVAAVAAVAFVMWPHGAPPSPTTSSTSGAKKSSKGSPAGAHQQAVAVNAILNASGTSRGELGRALTAARKCDGLGTAITGMQTVAQQRQQQINQTKALKVDALANGARIRSALAKSINYSLEVDKAYLSWALASQNKCKRRPKPNADSKRGARLSAQASSAKQQFAALWAPVAQKEGLPRRGPTSF